MYKRSFMTLVLTIIIITLFLCGCSRKIDNLSTESINLLESNAQINQELKLPENYTIDKIKSALLEYINYRLWLYPAKLMDGVSDKFFDNYVGKSIDVEIRVYNNDIENCVYAHTSIGEWLAVFNSKNGFIYCDGQISEGEHGWPSNKEKYIVIEKYSLIISEPHKPHYGTSQRKENMIALIEAKVKASCEDFYKGADRFYDEWKIVDVYITDFYEYENGAHVWLCIQDGSIINFPIVFEEVNNELTIITLKGFDMRNIDQFNEFGRFQFYKDKNDAVRNYIIKQ